MGLKSTSALDAIRLNRRIRKILPSTASRFGTLFEESLRLKTFVFIGNKPILSVRELVKEVESRQRNGETLDLIKKALHAINARAMPDRYSNELHLEKLISDLGKEEFFKIRTGLLKISDDPNQLLSRLRELEVFKRMYFSPLKLFCGTDNEYDFPQVAALTEKLFGGHITSALNSGIQPQINFTDTRTPNDLAKGIYNNYLANNGLILMLFEKAFISSREFIESNPYYKNRTLLDLGYLIPINLEKRFSNTTIEEIAHSQNHGYVRDFLFDAHALRVKS